MTTPVLLIAIVLATAVSSVVCPRAVAGQDEDLRALVNRVERETGGRVLSAERRSQSGREVSRIKVYTPEGRVRVMWDEPKPSALREPRPENQKEVRRTRTRDARPMPSRRDDY